MHRLFSTTGFLALFTLTSLLGTSCASERLTLENESDVDQVEPDNPEAFANDDDDDDDADEVSDVVKAEGITLRLGLGADWTGDPADAGPASLSLRVVADLLHQGLSTLQLDGSIGPGLADR